MANDGYDDFSDAITCAEADVRLHALLVRHKATGSRQKIHSFLFRQLEHAKKEIKALIFMYLKKMKKYITRVDVNIMALLRSSDPCLRILGRRLTRLFWNFYEFDEVVVYTIRKYRSFHGLLRANPKYKHVFRRILANEEVPGAGNATTHSHANTAKDDTAIETGKGGPLRAAMSIDELQRILKEQQREAATENKKIYSFFLDKIESMKNEDSNMIPGIEMAETSTGNEIEAVDPYFEIELLGLDASPVYKNISNALKRLGQGKFV